jgi:hypothetical protein
MSSSFIFKAMGKRSRPNCDKNGCKCKKQRKDYQLFTLRGFVLRDDFSKRINRVIRGFAVLVTLVQAIMALNVIQDAAG